jgi:uncharacterized protein with HEPN domain
MQHDFRAYLADIIATCDEMTTALEGVSYDMYAQQWVLRAAVERGFIIIGEALRKLLDEDPEYASKISNAQQIVGFRNRLTHAYMSIDDEVVYITAVTDAPTLKSECQRLIDMR